MYVDVCVNAVCVFGVRALCCACVVLCVRMCLCVRVRLCDDRRSVLQGGAFSKQWTSFFSGSNNDTAMPTMVFLWFPSRCLKFYRVSWRTSMLSPARVAVYAFNFRATW